MIMMDKLVSKAKALIGKIKLPDLKAVLPKALALLGKLSMLGIKALKGFMSWLWKAVKESIAQVWTLLGFFIAWLTLTGTAQQIVGVATVLATILWLVTIPLREEKEE
jgi:hypothetical protein